MVQIKCLFDIHEFYSSTFRFCLKKQKPSLTIERNADNLSKLSEFPKKKIFYVSFLEFSHVRNILVITVARRIQKCALELVNDNFISESFLFFQNFSNKINLNVLFLNVYF